MGVSCVYILYDDRDGKGHNIHNISHHTDTFIIVMKVVL